VSGVVAETALFDDLSYSKQVTASRVAASEICKPLKYKGPDLGTEPLLPDASDSAGEISSFNVIREIATMFTPT